MSPCRYSVASSGFLWRFRWRNFIPLGRARFPKVAEPALFESAVGDLQRDLRRPAVFGFKNVFDDASDAGSTMDHDFADVALAGC